MQLANGSVSEFKPRSIHACQIADDGWYELYVSKGFGGERRTLETTQYENHS
jgi:hypothetical protein